MKLCIISAIIITLAPTIISCNNSHNNVPSWNRETFAAVTQFEDLERYYLNLRSKQTNGSRKQPTMAVVKRICESIFGSPFFEMNRQEHWLPANCKLIRAELRTYPSVSDRICQKCCSEIWHKLFGCHDCSDGYHYENPYKQRPISQRDGERIRFEFENVFVCLTKERVTDIDRFREYFVSVEYDVNGVAETNIPVYARFIFIANMEEELVIHAIAEESTLPLEDGLRYSNQEYEHEWLYFVNKHRFKNYKSPREDTICRLNADSKLRLCATIFSSPSFRVVRFFPTMDRVRVDCEKITVSFRDPRRETEARTERNKLVYQDWMIACLVSLTDHRGGDRAPLKTYYVSRGLRSNHVFVHELVDDRVFVKFYMVNAGTVPESDVLDEND